MGEYSKRIGEIGENIVTDFLKIIGWNDIQKNFDIDSIDPEKHGKRSHGIDGFFHYRSPMISNTLEKILISVKFSNEKYKNDSIKQFKEYYVDLAIAIESFKKSELRNSTINQHSKIEATFDRGVLFWINNNIDDKTDLIQKLQRVELPKSYNHDGIILMDNKRVEFVFDALSYVKNLFHEQNSVQFSYFNTGLNSNDQSTKNGSIMPFQYLASNILPLRIQSSDNKVTTLVLCTRENFEKDELIKLIGLAKNIGNNFQTKTIIAFPDYNRVLHEQIVSNIKQSFEESSFTANLIVENYNPNFRN